ncbi:MAG: hypothetical protein GX046_01015 [Tissierellia bacterium]|nr:hypothetical protein [Tissierellia bacterium]
MKAKKLITLLAMLLIFTLITVGCTQKIEEKIGGKIVEKIAEKTTDGNVQIDTKDGVSITTDGGTMQSGENLKWPGESMGSLPEPKATIISILQLEEENSTMVILSFEKDNGGADYMEKIADLGYIQRMLTKSDESVMYLGVKDDNTALMFNYDPTDLQGSITLMRDDDNAKTFFETEVKEETQEPLAVDMSQSMKWPKESMDNIPELKAQISSISLNTDSVSIGYKNIGLKDITAYIEEIKALGFNKNSMESIMDNFISYIASDSKDRTININWGSNEGFINYTK